VLLFSLGWGETYKVLECGFGGFDYCLEVSEDEVRIGINDGYPDIVVVVMLSYQLSYSPFQSFVLTYRVRVLANHR
jgi:hypothetical protein